MMRWTTSPPAPWTPPVLAAVIAALGLAVCAPARAWHATGHMITVQIAYDDLSDEARREVDRLVSVLADYPPVRDHAVTASLWTDDLKRQGVEAFDGWHYINLPFRADAADADLPPPQPENVVWAIRQAVSTLRGPAGDLPKALMLRFLLHFVGDVHQPLHCATRITAMMPEGDRGGNDFPLRDRREHLHAYWDYGAELYPALDGQDWRPLVRRLTDRVVRRLPKSAVPEWTEADPRVWAEESHRLAVGVAYDGIAEGAEPSPEYAARAREVVRRRLVLGGYRLGALLNDIFAAAGEAP